MRDWLPYLYLPLLGLEVLVLGVIYAIDFPEPGDPLSIALGTIGLVCMIVMLVYSVARRSKMLRDLMRLSAWLHLHIFLGVTGVICVLFHSAQLIFKSYYLLNPGVLNLILVLIVFCSGLFGRYLYAQVPRALGGEMLEQKEVDAELAKLASPLPDGVVALWKNAPEPKGFFGMISADLATRRALRSLRGFQLDAPTYQLARRRVLLERRKAAWTGIQRFFHRWIILHRPLALMLYVLSFVHVALAFLFSPALRF